jgi:hypothetical protein
MTVPEAICALNAAPSDDKVSALNLGKTRRQFTQSVRDLVNRVKPDVMLLTPGTAKLVAQAAQDWPDPVEMRFIYDREGRMAVGWNREELEMRKGLRPRQGPVKLTAMMEQQARIAEIQRQQALGFLFQFAPVKAPEPPPPRPEPKPDPSSPKFVLKRPKPV